LKNLNDTLNKICADPNIPADKKAEIVINLSQTIKIISKSLPAQAPEVNKEEKVRKK
jgi:hypothetical protein